MFWRKIEFSANFWRCNKFKNADKACGAFSEIQLVVIYKCILALLYCWIIQISSFKTLQLFSQLLYDPGRKIE